MSAQALMALAEKLRHVPARHGVDDNDIEDLEAVAREVRALLDAVAAAFANGYATQYTDDGRPAVGGKFVIMPGDVADLRAAHRALEGL